MVASRFDDMIMARLSLVIMHSVQVDILHFDSATRLIAPISAKLRKQTELLCFLH